MDATREQAMADSLTEIKTVIATICIKIDLLVARIDPALVDYEQRLRVLEKRPDSSDLAKRVREVERWQWKRDGLLVLGSSGITGVIIAVINTLPGVHP